jgi:hypothetical protein
MTVASISLPSMGQPVDELWTFLLDLGERLTVRWTLIGGQMVLLHALEHGHSPSQVSQDGDVVADIRADQGSLRTVVEALELAGFDLESMSTDGIAHRYTRSTTMSRPVVVDLLAPEGVGERADLSTTPPGRTIEVPGGTQALDRSELVVVDHAGRTGAVFRPSLLGALVIKGAACGLGGDVSRHHRDLALLCSLVEDPFVLAEQMSAKDRQRLRCASAIAEEHDHMAWQLLPSDVRSDARATLRELIRHTSLGLASPR